MEVAGVPGQLRDQMSKDKSDHYDRIERREVAAIYPHRFFIVVLEGYRPELRYEMLDVRDPEEEYTVVSREDYLAILQGSHATSLESIAAALGGDRVISGDLPTIADRIDDSAGALEHLAEHLVGIEPDVGLVMGTDTTSKPEPS